MPVLIFVGLTTFFFVMGVMSGILGAITRDEIKRSYFIGMAVFGYIAGMVFLIVGLVPALIQQS